MRYIISILIITICVSFNLTAAPNLTGKWIVAFGRYSEIVTFNADGTFESEIEVVRGAGANQDEGRKSKGTWKLNGDKLEQTLNGETSTSKIRMKSPTMFELSDDLVANDVLVYEKSQSIDTNSSSAQIKNAITHPKIGSPERSAIMTAMRGPVSKYAKKEIVFNGDVDVLGNWARLTGHVNPKSGKFSQDLVDELELDFMAILQKVGGAWKLSYFGWSGDIYTSVQARQKLPNLPEALVPSLESMGVEPFVNQERFVFIDGESNFRAGPHVKSAVKFQPNKGTTGSLLERNGKWLKLELKNGDSGWAHESNLKSED
jgi:hypothetical protein